MLWEQERDKSGRYAGNGGKLEWHSGNVLMEIVFWKSQEESESSCQEAIVNSKNNKFHDTSYCLRDQGEKKPKLLVQHGVWSRKVKKEPPIWNGEWAGEGLLVPLCSSFNRPTSSKVWLLVLKKFLVVRKWNQQVLITALSNFLEEYSQQHFLD
jgi:hypothetical protein